VRGSFVAGKHAIYFSYKIHDALSKGNVTDTEYREFITALFEYDRNGIEPTFSNNGLNMLFEAIRPEIDFYQKKYDAIVEKRREAGRKGGAPQGNRNATGNRGGGAPRGNRNAAKKEAPDQGLEPKPENKHNPNNQMFEFEPEKQTQAESEIRYKRSEKEEFNVEKIPEPSQEPPGNQTPSPADAVVLYSPILSPGKPGNLPVPQDKPPAFSPVDSPPKKKRKLELTTEQNGLYHAAKTCFESSDRARAIIYQDQSSAEMQMRKLKEIIIRCSNIAPGITVDFLKTVLEHFRVMTNNAKYKGNWVFTPRCLSTHWIWEIVISSLPERETELDRNIQESIKGLFKKR
jgi:hypothetical protein